MRTITLRCSIQRAGRIAQRLTHTRIDFRLEPLRDPLNLDAWTLHYAHDHSSQVVELVDDICAEDESTAIARAREDYELPSNDELEIDDDPATSRGEDGVWVAAWVWVADDSGEDNEEDCDA